MKILVATDGTKHSRAAIEKIADFNLNSDDEINIVSVVDMAVPMSIDMYGGYITPSADIEKSVREVAEKILVDAKTFISEQLNIKDVSVNTEILYGSPDSRIVETAEKIKADLIIVGSHGYNRWERILLGSVSDSVVHHAPCSVLVVRTPDE
jgi:nucleotide-binding universal stress UspA family protein